MHQRGRNLVRPRAGLHELLKGSPGAFGDVQQRSERTRSEQRVTSAPEKPHLAVLVAEGAQELGLADASLSADQHDAPSRAASDGLEELAERRQVVAALE
jgi:hypothetical protein